MLWFVVFVVCGFRGEVDVAVVVVFVVVVVSSGVVVVVVIVEW